MTRTVHVRYFAILREQRGLSAETLSTAAPDTSALYEELRAKHALAIPPASVRVALRDEILVAPAPLSDGDEVAFIPPISGG